MINWPSFIAALILSSVIAFGLYIRIWASRGLVSAAAGVSIAYVFMDMFPLINERQQAFLHAVSGQALLAAEYRVYLSALIGFVIFYGLENMVVFTRTPEHSQEFTHRGGVALYRIHIIGFAAYSALIGYLLVEWTKGWLSLVLYVTALALHFFVVDHSMEKEYGRRYYVSGRWILTVSLLIGWVIGVLTPFSETVLATVVGLIAGGVVINSLKDELPKAGDGKIAPFSLGSLGYAALLILTGS